MESDTKTQAPGAAGTKSRWREWLRRSETLAPTFAVVTVVLAAVAATVATQWDGQERDRRPAVSTGPKDVVKAPPRVVQAPPLQTPAKPGAQARRQTGEAPTASNALGAGPSCPNCGVVESVVVVNQPSRYQLRIRMDDGTVRTVEQRSALAAGSRVLLEGGSVRLMPAGTRQG